MEFVVHPMIKDGILERRLYQITIAMNALIKNTLVIIPTGLGKTSIAVLVIASRILNEKGKALFLAPTRPLVEQHANFLKRTLKVDENEIVAMSGEDEPEKRVKLWNSAKVIVATPQVVENDLIAGRASLEDVVIAVFDEAHRAVGNYSYVFIAEEYMRRTKKPLILALTASPGSDPERIMEVVKNLKIESIEFRTERDEDVIPYVSEKEIEWIKVEVPKEITTIKEKLETSLKIRVRRIKELGIEIPEKATKRELLELQEVIQNEIGRTQRPELFEASSILAEILKISHAIELIETQSVESFRSYLNKILKESSSKGGSKASKSIANDPSFRDALILAMRLNTEHPKIEKLKEIIRTQLAEKEDSRIIVFTNYRDSADFLVSEISKIAPAFKFIGQADRENERGMKQKEQVEVLQKFREGIYKVLVATSIGEEGLDIPATDLVVFYEAIPSEIRAIQRKGRTGRGRKGKIIVLMAKGTRDEVYYYTSLRKERAMFEKLKEVKLMLEKREFKGQARLLDFERAGIKILVDSREMRSEVVKILRELGANLEIKNLEVADYVLSDRVAVERKTVDDFVDSLISERLFSQLLNLKSYQRPILVLEGGNLYTRAVHPNAIRGAIATIVTDFGIPMIFTKDEKETAEFLIAIARREQEEKKREVVEHYGKTKRTLKEEQEYIVSAISNVGSVIAKNLLEHFQTIERIATASEKELMEVPKVGKKTAEHIRLLMTTPYSEADKYDIENF
ncbi:MAG: DEAD/DEAH box helicase [Archaeoglobaceae archaeon]|nr:DEAD/DEAH box helicase [Archaeoglobaceae archaeon]MDW8127588.1 DEAD/DEAH box helicase [Archaeoglobaceae archaeon]